MRDLSSLISVLESVRPDRIYHLAAQSFVPYSWRVPVDTLDTNVIGTANLLEAILFTESAPELIHICSSSEVYGQPDYTPIDEEHPCRPLSPYAVSKLAEERLAWAYCQAEYLPVVITRAFSHTGPRRADVFVCSDFAKQLVYGNDIAVGNLDSVRTFCDVRDMVRAYWLLNGEMSGEVYNIGGSATMTIGQMLGMLVDIAGYHHHVVSRDPTRIRPTDVTLQIPCCQKFKSVTGWETQIPFRRTLEDLFEYWRERA